MGDTPEVTDKEGISWRELLTDKAIDVVLIPLGLFAALWFQGWVDDRQKVEDYVDQLQSFRAEIAANRDKAKAMEAQIGPIAEREGEAVLGPLGAVFPASEQVLDNTVKILVCLEDVLSPPTSPPDSELAELMKTEAGQKRIADFEAAVEAYGKRSTECEALFDAEAPASNLEIVDLSPLYRYEVWQMYLQDGIKLFKGEEAKALGRKLGEAYASAREVELRVSEIEVAYNDHFTRMIGDGSALTAELEQLIDLVGPDGGGEPVRRIHEMISEVRRQRFAMRAVQAMLQAKVGRLKAFVDEMDTRFREVDQAIAAEIARRE